MVEQDTFLGGGYAVCPHCGQMVEADPAPGETAAEAAENVCDCLGAMAARRRKEQIRKAYGMTEALFGADCKEKYGTRRVSETVISVIEVLCKLALDGEIRTAKLTIPGICSADISIGQKGEIKLKRTEGRSFTEGG